MNVKLENENLVVSIKSKGAELFSVVNKQTGLEYMWSGDPAFWGKTSPVLFPIVGTLKKDTYIFNDREYKLSRHGFARDAEFEVENPSPAKAVFRLRSNPESLLVYPFEFQLSLAYTLEGNSLVVSYGVENAGKSEMYFSVGAHPAFKVPLADASTYEDHYLEFNKPENAPRWPISKEGLIESEGEAFLKNETRISLKKSLFDRDAIVLKNLSSDVVSIRSSAHNHGFDFTFKGFPYLGIWAAKNADFVCIEPWCGIADSVTHDQQFVSKEGVEKIAGGQCWSRAWRAKFY